jgi:hypothetical protein
VGGAAPGVLVALLLLPILLVAWLLGQVPPLQHVIAALLGDGEG